MRKKIVAGNWKMNKSCTEAKILFAQIKELQEDLKNEVELVVCPPAIYLTDIIKTNNGSGIKIGAQNCFDKESGAFTGEVSANMLKSINADCCIVGHSERRSLFQESNADIKLKVDALLNMNLTPIFCCGESLQERESGDHFKVIETQISEAILHLEEDAIKNVVIAYEPVWAIGTGVTASSTQAQEIHAFIRDLLARKYNTNVAESISILYGGSCKPENAKELFSCKDVDGGLIGGAALKASSFLEIAKSF